MSHTSRVAALFLWKDCVWHRYIMNASKILGFEKLLYNLLGRTFTGELKLDSRKKDRGERKIKNTLYD